MTSLDSEKPAALERTATTSTLDEDLPPSSLLSTPSRRLHIASNGIACLRFPRPSRELEIGVFTDDDFSKKVYSSLRAAYSSGSCTLSAKVGDDKKGEPERWVDVATTKYRFGPGRDPVIAMLSLDEPQLSASAAEHEKYTKDDLANTEKQAAQLALNVHEKELTSPSMTTLGSTTSTKVEKVETTTQPNTIPIKSVSLFSRAQKFTYKSNTFTWSYARLPPSETGEKVSGSLLELRLLPTSGKSKEEGILLAQFFRTDETRTPGTRSSSAGNGGVLITTSRVGNTINNFNKDRDGGCDIEEHLVVASIICMLKKEIDRRRRMQMMIIAAVISGA